MSSFRINFSFWERVKVLLGFNVTVWMGYDQNDVEVIIGNPFLPSADMDLTPRRGGGK